MDKDNGLSCVDCGMLNCESGNTYYPEFCLTTALSRDAIEKVRQIYEEDENNRVSVVSAQIENEFYLKYTRVEELIEFARRMDYSRIGIATCVGLINESRTLARILRKNGFEVYGAVCKVGAFNKTDIGVAEKDTTVSGPIMCNPIMQAEILNAQNTDLNVVVGLCIGHDSLFYKYSKALVTTLIAKDRVLAHNPVGALYQTGSYYSKLIKTDQNVTDK